MPHTWIVWVYAQNVHSRIATQEMSAVRHPLVFENYHISILGLTKTLSICLLLYPNSTTKLKRISETNNTLWGHCSARIKNEAE